MTKIATIIVNFNGMKWVDACLTSVIKQKLPNHYESEIIFIDNGSTDGSEKLVKDKFPEVIVITLPQNLGFGSACNLGVSGTNAELIVILNNDTILNDGTLSCLLTELLTHSLDAIAAIEVPYEGGTSNLRRTTIDLFGYPVHLYEGQRLSNLPSFYLSAVCLLFKRETYLDTNGFDEDFFMYFEDIDWFWRLQLQNYKFDYAYSCTVRHAGHGSTGGKKLSYDRFLWRNSNTPRMLIKNLRIGTLCWIMPLYYTSYIIEYLLLNILGRRDLARSYVDGMGVFTKNWRSLLKSRQMTQHSRTVGDWPIMKRMYPGIAKVHGLRSNGLPHFNGRI